MSGLLQDLRFGLRMLAKSPGFAAVAIITLALGIGANAAIFQLIDAVRLRTLPVKDPQTLAIIHVNKNHWGQGNFSGDYPDFTYGLWRQVEQRQQPFSSAAVWGSNRVNLASGGEVNFANAIWVSGQFFKTLGIQPLLGRLISTEDNTTGCSGGVDLSYAFWQRRYAGAASVIGREITLEGHPFPILGVTPPSFYGVSVGDRFDIAAPICAEPIVHIEDSKVNGPRAQESWWLAGIGRLKPGWTLNRATVQLEVIMPAALHETIPPQYDADGVKHYLAYKLEARPAENGFSDLRQNGLTPLWMLLGLSGLVLLIACANLANLMLARASAREREIAVRLALGASRARLVRQLLAESALLAVAGTIAGGFLASALSRFLVAFISTRDNPIFLDMPTDWRVMGFAAGLALLTTVLFGLAPAVRAGRAPLGAVMKTGGRGTTAGRGRFRLQRMLVTAQVALSLVLLAGALLFARSLRNLLTRNLGFRQDGVLVAETSLARLKLPSSQRYAFERGLLERIRAIPGVEAAAASERSPAGQSSSNDWVLSQKSNENLGSSWMDWISPDYFRTMEIGMVAGRDFQASDTLGSPKIAIVNQEFVKKFLGGKEGVGKQFRLWESPGKPEPFYTVVGVVDDSVYQDLHAPNVPIAYMPRSQTDQPDAGAVYMIRTRGGAAGVVNAVKDAIVGMNPEIDLQFTVLRTQIRQSLVQDELMALLSGFFGGLAVLLAAIGLYGMISYTVGQRTNEIGVRMALGAQSGTVLRMILREVGVLIAIGVAVGTLITLAAGKTAGSMLYELKPRDPVTLALAVAVLAAIGLVASLVPARRASRLEAVVALRYE